MRLRQTSYHGHTYGNLDVIWQSLLSHVRNRSFPEGCRGEALAIQMGDSGQIIPLAQYVKPTVVVIGTMAATVQAFCSISGVLRHPLFLSYENVPVFQTSVSHTDVLE